MSRDRDLIEANRASAAEAERDQARKERDELLSAIKRHRNATECSDSVLKPDRDLYQLVDRISGNAHEVPEAAQA